PEPEAEPAVRRAAVPEAVQVMAHRTGTDTLLPGLLEQDVVPVFTLCTGGRLHALPDEVEAQRRGRIAGRAHVVARAHARRVVRHEDELVPGALRDVGA